MQSFKSFGTISHERLNNKGGLKMAFSVLVSDMDDNELLSSYDYYQGLMFKSIRDDLRLGQVENELRRRGITYDFDEALLEFIKGVNHG